ncbi:MAG: hypothetical protein D6732_20115 [Methanobacteriota archaeon]|nr:MAG: hypothetical protein D6732_20115 [Euryarchaeota archaeon]
MKKLNLIFLILFFISCSVDKTPLQEKAHNGNTDSDYVPGEIAVGIKDSVSLLQFADYIYSFEHISIKEIVYYVYSSSLPKDSMMVIKNTLLTKSYIWDDGQLQLSYSNERNRILIKIWFRNFRSEDRDDWRELKERFSLTHEPFAYQTSLLQVEERTEQEWIGILSQSDFCRYVELNYIVSIATYN